MTNSQRYSYQQQQQQHQHFYTPRNDISGRSSDADIDADADDTNDGAYYNPYGTITPTPTMTAASFSFSKHHNNNSKNNNAGNRYGQSAAATNVVNWPSSEEEDNDDIDWKLQQDVKESKLDDGDHDYYFRRGGGQRSGSSSSSSGRIRRRKDMPETISGGLPPRSRPYLHPIATMHDNARHDGKMELSAEPPSTVSPPTTTANAIPETNKTNTAYQDRLDEAERHVKVLESNVALHKRLSQLEDELTTRDKQFEQLQSQLQELLRTSQGQEQHIQHLKQQQQQQQHGYPSPKTTILTEEEQWDAAVVTWKIAKFEKTLTADRHFYESSPFAVGCYASFYLTVCVLEVDDDVPESKRPVAIFLKAAVTAKETDASSHSNNNSNHRQNTRQQSSSIFPIRLDGSKITLVSNMQYGGGQDQTVQVGQTQMEDSSQGKGVRQFVTLGKLRQSFLQNDASVVIRATVRVPHIPIYRLKTIS